MAQVFPLNLNDDALGDDQRSLAATLAGLPEQWTLLRDRRLGDEPVDAVLIHPEIGVALIGLAPRALDAAAAALGEQLERERFGAFFPGTLPLVTLPVAPEEIPEIGERLAAAFEGAPRLDIADAAWADAVIELLLMPNDVAMAPANPFATLPPEPVPPPETEPDAAAWLPPPEAMPAPERPFILRAEERGTYLSPRRPRAGVVAAAVLATAVIALIGIGAWSLVDEDNGPPPAGTQRAAEVQMPAVPHAPETPAEATGTPAPPPVPAAPPVQMAAKPLAPPPPAPPRPTKVEPLPEVAESTAPPATPPPQTAAAQPRSPPPEQPAEAAPAPAEATPSPPAKQQATAAPPPPAKAKPRRAAKSEAPSEPKPRRTAKAEPDVAPSAPAREAPRGPPVDAGDLPPLDQPASPPRPEIQPVAVAPLPPPPAQPAPPAAAAIGRPVPLGPPSGGAPRPLSGAAAGAQPTPVAAAPAQRECRPYTADTTLTGRSAAVEGIACRGPDGQWRLISEVPVR